MEQPSFEFTAQGDKMQLFRYILDELSITDLDNIEKMARSKRNYLTKKYISSNNPEIIGFIQYILDKLGIEIIESKRIDKRTGYFVKCLCYHLYKVKCVSEKDIAYLIKRDRSDVLYHVRSYMELSELYTDEALMFKQQKIKFNDVVREYYNNVDKLEMVNESENN